MQVAVFIYIMKSVKLMVSVTISVGFTRRDRVITRARLRRADAFRASRRSSDSGAWHEVCLKCLRNSWFMDNI
jgi:hypothetical protein